MNETNKQRAIAVIKTQKQTLAGIVGNFDVELPMWRDRTIRFLSGCVVPDELRILAQVNSDSWDTDKAAFKKFLIDLEAGINSLPDLYLQPDEVQPGDSQRSSDSVDRQVVSAEDVPAKVFIVHGHDSLAKTEVSRTIEKLGLEAVVLHEQPNQGRTIIEKFESSAAGVGFAVIVLTPDDAGHPANKPDETAPRARQNVILELGYFSGVLGRKRVAVLHKGGVEIPSDYIGVVYIPMDDAGSWRFGLARELRSAGLPADLNRLA